jgi:hypothetical protein
VPDTSCLLRPHPVDKRYPHPILIPLIELGLIVRSECQGVPVVVSDRC